MHDRPSMPGTKTVAALVAILFSLSACDRPPSVAARPRLILIGIDGAAPRIVNELLEQGRLPHLDRIAERGVYGTLESESPSYSPRIWNTIVTGKHPKEHGISGFFHNDGESDVLYYNTDRTAPALWTILDRAGLRTAVVNFWNTYPPEKIDGVMVSDHILAEEIAGLKKLAGASSEVETGRVIHPRAWDTRLARAIEEQPTLLPEIESPFTGDNVLPGWAKQGQLQRRFREDGVLAYIAREILDAEHPEVMFLLLPGIDRVSHFLWGVVEPPDAYPDHMIPTSEEREGGKQALFEYYEFTDALIGALTMSFGPEDRVLILSDHGFESGHPMPNITGTHESSKSSDGVLFARGPGIVPGSDAGDISIDDITPTVLTWLGLPAGSDMQGRVAPFLAIDPLPPVDSYDGIEVEFVDTQSGSSGVEDEIVEQLKALGYTETP